MNIKHWRPEMVPTCWKKSLVLYLFSEFVFWTKIIRFRWKMRALRFEEVEIGKKPLIASLQIVQLLYIELVHYLKSNLWRFNTIELHSRTFRIKKLMVHRAREEWKTLRKFFWKRNINLEKKIYKKTGWWNLRYIRSILWIC